MTDIYRLGKDAKAYRNTNTYGSPTWVEIDIVKDATLSLDKGEFDGSRRGSGGWKQSAGTMKSAEIELDILHKPGDAGYEALRDSFLNNTVIDMAIMDGNILTSGSEGLRAEMEVFSLSREEKLEEGIMVKVKLKPRISTNAPTWLEI